MTQRRLSKYELQEPLGQNTGSKRWKAFDTQQQHDVAIEIIEVNPDAANEFLPRLSSDMQAVAALHHPNIVPIEDFSVTQDGHEAYVVMDYVEGLPLSDYLDATAHTGQIPSAAEIVQLLTPLASALDYAHQHGVLHGSLNPSTILLDKQVNAAPLPGEPKLINFSLQQRQDPRLLSLDKVAYIAPEVAQGYTATKRGDLYSLGVILYELCTGALPFQGETTNDILMQHIHDTPTSPALINPRIRPALTSVIMRSLSRDPAGRFATAMALITAVARATNVKMPEISSQPHLAPNVSNPPSFNGISNPPDAADSTTYLSSPPSFNAISNPSDVADSATYLSPAPSRSSSTPLVPPTINSNNTPFLPPTPVLPITSTGTMPTLQQTSTPTPFSQQASGSYTPYTVSSKPLSAPTLTTQPPMSPMRKRRIGIFAALSVLLLIVLIGSGLLLYLSFTHIAPGSNIVGHAFFVSSGLISKESNQGVTDQFRISLQNIPDPEAGKSYYGWLMSSASVEISPLALGPLPVKQGKIAYTYSGSQHDNLLANYSRFLITEEDASQQPTNPSLDTSTWRYYAAFSTAANPADPKKYSLLDHLRHLLSQDPKLANNNLSGGLDVWLFRNTSKILEAAGSARDTQKACTANAGTACTDFILRQVARILDYLDGATYVKTENIPAAIQGAQLLIDPTIARVALLEFDPVNQEPPGYLKHIGSHLQEISELPGATSDQQALANRINNAINNVQGWLDAVHADASKLIHLSSSQLLQPDALTTLNDLFVQANNAFVGQVDPNTNRVKDGVVEIHYNIQALATFNVAPCTTTNGQNSCA